MSLTRRDLLRSACLSFAAPALSAAARTVASPDDAPPLITCFYQFGPKALAALSGPDGLPNRPGALHIFSHSHPGLRAHPETANAVHACGASFKYAMAFDVHKYKGWMQAPDDQLRKWAVGFRALALDPKGKADYFAFNEMPTTGAATPHLRQQAAKLVRYLHDPGGADAGPKLRGVFYFTERNLNPAHWQGDAGDFWAALDESCDLVVGEHYHSYDFEMDRAPAALADHLFALPKWLAETGGPAGKAIAERKYAVLHSSYYGPRVSGWAGVNSDKHDLADYEKYLRHCVEATRLSSFGKRRIAFGPLAATDFDQRALPVLARVLRTTS